MLEQPRIFSLNKHTENKNKLKIECPLKFNTPECGTECIGINCAWWMTIQRACAVNVNARILDTKRGF